MPVLASLTRLLLDAVAPLRCAACDAVASSPICPRCVEQLQSTAVPAPIRVGPGRAVAAFPFAGAVREVVHRGKFQGNRGGLRQLAELAVPRLAVGECRRDCARPAKPDAVVAVPLGSRRRRQRGYNQAEIIAAVLAEASGAALLGGLVRTRETQPQAEQGEAARRTNVAGAFEWRGTDVAGAALWLVDDVLTTGATIEAAAWALRRAGVLRVDALCIAHVL